MGLLIIALLLVPGCLVEEKQTDELTPSNGRSATGKIAIVSGVARTGDSSNGRIVISIDLIIQLKAGSEVVTVGSEGDELDLTIGNGSVQRTRPEFMIGTISDEDGDPAVLSRDEMMNLTIDLVESDLGVGPGDTLSVKIEYEDDDMTIGSYIMPQDLDEEYIQIT